jgi:exodeoxyribonuclease VII small subunit
MSKKTDKLPALEESMAEITQLIEKMERGELTLEQSLGDFERGVSLVKHCQKILTEAEQKVQLLTQQNGQDTLTNYDEADED